MTTEVIDMQVLAEPEVARPLELPGFHEGVWFGMPEADYHAVPALSNSGIKNLLVSPMDFWARSWLNPDKEDEPSPQMELGKAYDKRIVEGRHAFARAYAPALVKEDAKFALVTMDDIREAMKDRGLKGGKTKADCIAILNEADPGLPIWDILESDHAAEHAGKTLLHPDVIARIEIAAAMIEKHPELSKCFTGGQPQVSVFWYDRETGVPMKARYDYLKPRAIIDLKTFSNPLMKPVDRAVATAMASGKYHVQMAVYLEGAAQSPRLIAGGEVNGEVSDEFLNAVAAVPDKRFLFVFQQTGVAPVARGYELPRGLVYDCGVMAMRAAQIRFRECFAAFGSDPWIDTQGITAFDDAGFPAYMTEI